MTKSSLSPVSILQRKIFLTDQINFPIGQKCFPQKLKMGHISIIDHDGMIYMETQRTCSMILFPSAKQDEWKLAFGLTQRSLVYKSSSVKTNKHKNQCSAARERA